MPDILFHEDETAEDWRRLGRRLEGLLNARDALEQSLAVEVAKRQEAEAQAADLAEQVDRQRADINELISGVEAWRSRAERAEKALIVERAKTHSLQQRVRDLKLTESERVYQLREELERTDAAGKELACQLRQRSRLFTFSPQTLARTVTGAQYQDERLVPREPLRGEMRED